MPNTDAKRRLFIVETDRDGFDAVAEMVNIMPSARFIAGGGDSLGSWFSVIDLAGPEAQRFEDGLNNTYGTFYIRRLRNPSTHP